MLKGVAHWWVSNNQSLLFDAVASKLPLLDLADTRLMEDIYTSNDSGWIKIGVVRDPVTRVVSAYLDLVRSWPSGATGWPPLVTAGASDIADWRSATTGTGSTP